LLFLIYPVKEKSFKMINLGDAIRKLRESKDLPLRTVAAYLNTDQAILSKIERGQRKATREQVIKLAEYFQVKETDLLIAWLSDKIVYEIEEEEVALKALEMAEEKVAYRKTIKTDRSGIIKTISNTLKNDGRVAAAWLYGSLARGEASAASDVDIMVALNHKKKYSMFDLIDIAYNIEQKINRKVDIVEQEQLKEFAKKTAMRDLIKIYG